MFFKPKAESRKPKAESRKPKAKRLIAKRQRLEDEILGYLIARKSPPGKLMEQASKIKMELELHNAARH